MKKVLTLFLVFFAYHTFGTMISGPQDIHMHCMNSQNPSFPGVMPMSYEQCVASISTVAAPTRAVIGGGRAPAVVGFSGMNSGGMTPPGYFLPPNYGQRTIPPFVSSSPYLPGVSNGGRDFRRINPIGIATQPYPVSRPLNVIPH
jgi:hypothetical protein